MKECPSVDTHTLQLFMHSLSRIILLNRICIVDPFLIFMEDVKLEKVNTWLEQLWIAELF